MLIFRYASFIPEAAQRYRFHSGKSTDGGLKWKYLRGVRRNRRKKREALCAMRRKTISRDQDIKALFGST
jgi:hypothetical protein